MYTSRARTLVKEWGIWLNSLKWDYFTTITYRFDMSANRNEKIMLRLEHLLAQKLPNREYSVFWVMEQTSGSQHTHNHLLIKTTEARRELEKYLTSQGLIDERFVKHEPYSRELGANYYVSKYLNSPDARYGMICK